MEDVNQVETTGDFLLNDFERLGLKYLYISSLVVWFLIVFFLGFFLKSNFLSKLILTLPVLVFLCNILIDFNSKAVVDPRSTQANILTFFFIVAGVLVNWQNPSNKNKRLAFRKRFMVALMMSFFFLLIGHVECSAMKNNPHIESHIDLVTNTLSLTLMGYALSEFFFSEYGAVSLRE